MQTPAKRRLAILVADYLTVNVGWLGFNVIRYFTLPYLAGNNLLNFLCYPSLLIEQVCVPLFVLLLYAVSGIYNRSTSIYRSRVDETVNAAVVAFVAMIAVYFAVLVNDNIPERLASYELMASLWLCLCVPTAVVRLILTTRSNNFSRRLGNGLRTVVVGATDATAGKIAKIMASSPKTGLSVTACLNCDDEPAPASIGGVPVTATADALESCRSLNAQAVIVLPADRSPRHTGELLNRLYGLDVPIFVTPDALSLMAVRPRLNSVVAGPIVDITNANLSPVAMNLKRIGDVVCSALALVVLSPVLGAIALAVKLDSPGPVLYRQKRIGYHKKPFRIIKFRTMVTDAETEGPALSVTDDPRVTRVGRVLRKYRLDELPQFWNVLTGDMSLVGPRPEREYFIQRIIERVPSYSLIHQVRPGITSWGMVKYGYASNVDEMIERLAYDLLYIENLSLGVDLKILFHTIRTVAGGKGL